MLDRLVDSALRNRLLALVAGMLVLAFGIISFRSLPIEAYPDVADPWVTVVTQWPGRAAEEVEQQITIPLEIELSGVARRTHMRSTSLFGLSVVTLLFDDRADHLQARQQVLEKLSQVTLPAGAEPELGPDYSPVGEIYFYTLASTNPFYGPMELKALQDWVVEKELRSVPGVVDVSGFGGLTREYQVQVDPERLVAYDLTLADLEEALERNNSNAGGSYVERGQQAFNVRSVGLMQGTGDIGGTVIRAVDGTPVRVRDVATVVEGPRIRLGKVGRAINHANGKVVDGDDVVEGVVLLRKGARSEEVLDALHARVGELNESVLPAGVTVEPYLDRSELVHYTTRTVLRNLAEGFVLVTVVLLLFLGNIRAALLVALTVPLSLLFAAILLNASGIPANLLSLGALDFGIVVHGASVMVENIIHRRKQDPRAPVMEVVRSAAAEVQRPIFFAALLIITAFLPIFTLQRVEGRLFRPMAWTVSFALVGALLFALLLAPALASYAFRGGVREWRNRPLEWLTARYERMLGWCVARPRAVLAAAAGALLLTVVLGASGVIGSEFLPHLDEGGVWVRGTLPASVGPSEGERMALHVRRTLASFPEVRQVVSRVGRPDDGRDAAGFFNTEYFVDLRPHGEWRRGMGSKDVLIDSMNARLEQIPGAAWNFSQPIQDNVEEAVSGVKGSLAIKLSGSDLRTLESTANEIVAVMRTVPGVEDLGVFRVTGQPTLNITVDREAAERFGVHVADVQDVVEAALGGKVVSEILRGEQRFDLVMRYQEPFRRSMDDIARIRLRAPGGERVSLGQLARIGVEDGASMIYRESGQRYLAIKYSVRGRDLGSTVRDAMDAVERGVTLPRGYRMDWTGEYESQQRAARRLAVVVPITLLLVTLILYTAFASFRSAGVILAAAALAPLGGMLALLATGTHFSVSSGLGFLVLTGISVQTGVILLEHVNQLHAGGLTPARAALVGGVERLRPVMMTMLVAMLGLLPASLSHAIGSDSQRPFAIVIVGGLVLALVVNVFLIPVLAMLAARGEPVAVEG